MNCNHMIPFAVRYRTMNGILGSKFFGAVRFDCISIREVKEKS